MDKYAWAAGWLEGEGYFCNRGKSAQVSAASTDLDNLEKMQDWFGGYIYDRPTYKEHHKQAWLWVLNSWDAADLMVNIQTMMGKRRKKDIDDVLEVFWTSSVCATNIICNRGHQVIGLNRKTRKNNKYKVCVQCSREWNRESKKRIKMTEEIK